MFWLMRRLLVSLLLTPQALAYAQLAGLPAEAGLFASILPARNARHGKRRLPHRAR